MISITAVEPRLGEIGDFLGIAIRAANLAIKPASGDHELTAVFMIAEVLDGFLEGAGRFHGLLFPCRENQNENSYNNQHQSNYPTLGEWKIAASRHTPAEYPKLDSQSSILLPKLLTGEYAKKSRNVRRELLSSSLRTLRVFFANSAVKGFFACESTC
jgi:hypothetical protein